MTLRTIGPRTAPQENLMDREAIEDLVHSALGRQLRVTCLLGLLFLVVGFVLGHMVAAQHSRELASSWEVRAGNLTTQVEQLESRLQGEIEQIRTLATTQQSAAEQAALSQVQRDAQMLEETRRLSKATEDLRRSLIARCIEETQLEKVRMLRELQPYVDRRMTLKATEVSEAVNRLVDSQINHLKSLAQAENDLECGVGSLASAASFPTVGSSIAPASAQRCPPPQLTLTPIPDPAPLPIDNRPTAPLPPSTEPIALVPAPVPDATPEPVTAEPATEATATAATPQPTPAESTPKVPFFQAPIRPRLFIPSGRSAAVKTAQQTVTEKK